MSKQTQPNSAPAYKGGRPYKHLWMVEDRDKNGQSKSYWTKVGVAFENRDGSYTLELAAVPVNGSRLQMRDPFPRDEMDAGERRAA
jgi:hypothetical protein